NYSVFDKHEGILHLVSENIIVPQRVKRAIAIPGGIGAKLPCPLDSPPMEDLIMPTCLISGDMASEAITHRAILKDDQIIDQGFAPVR
ncbi:MAG: hypothetical protein AAF512_25110, partial [Pseudomonadota bacterium]